MELDRCVKNLLIKEPFYGLFMLNLNRFYSDKVPTAGVRLNGINFELAVNKDFFENLSENEAIAVLKHEVSHIIYKHPIYGPEYSNHTRFNYAADLEVNSAIPELQKIPYVYPALFNFDSFKGTKWYYDNLPDFPQNGSTSTANGGGELVDDHSSWKEASNISESEKQLISNQVDFIAKNTVEQVKKTCGSIPGQFKEYIDSLFKIKKQVFNWKAYFRRMLGTIIDIDIKKTRKKESNRFPEASGLKHKRKSNIFLIIDTSGSVSKEEACDFFSEIYHIYKAGTKVTVCECDTKINRIYEYSGKWDGKILGRGGTILSPAINYFNQNRRNYQTVVIFTDGYIESNPSKILGNTMWIITSNGDHSRQFPGKTLYIPKE